jgi:hypothetical protein
MIHRETENRVIVRAGLYHDKKKPYDNSEVSK